GLDNAQTHGALGAYCPAVLFPYARQIISDLVMHGGFPPLVLQHMNFDAMYADQMRRQQEENTKQD
ncbi:MAG: protein-export chaperone SecB, partial [bacterium]